MSKNANYYNYISFYRGIPVYIGKGKGERLSHTVSGRSENNSINEFYFRCKLLGDMPLDTYKIKNFNKEDLAYKRSV
jgi:hypothetical protein